MANQRAVYLWVGAVWTFKGWVFLTAYAIRCFSLLSLMLHFEKCFYPYKCAVPRTGEKQSGCVWQLSDSFKVWCVLSRAQCIITFFPFWTTEVDAKRKTKRHPHLAAFGLIYLGWANNKSLATISCDSHVLQQRVFSRTMTSLPL